MTRAKRYSKKYKDAQSRCPTVVFQGTTATADSEGDLCLYQGAQGITIPHARIPAFVKFLKENFVRRDK